MKEHLAEVDALVFDMQDIGCRFYTYISTMGLAMEAAEEAGIKFIVLDRINPIGGSKVAGPLRDGESKFVAFHEIPVQHGMTAGEIAKLYQSERFPQLDLKVVPLRHWKRSMRFDETGLPWVKPSPNMPNLTAATLYPGLGLLEFTNLSVGRGTKLPFEIVGAPYIVPEDLADQLTTVELPGLQFIPNTLHPGDQHVRRRRMRRGADPPQESGQVPFRRTRSCHGSSSFGNSTLPSGRPRSSTPFSATLPLNTLS